MPRKGSPLSGTAAHMRRGVDLLRIGCKVSLAMTNPPIKGHLLQSWAVRAGCDPGTARRFLRGEPVRLTTRTCLLRAAEELGLLSRLPVDLTE